DGLTFDIGGGDGSGNQDWPSEIQPRTGASAVFEYSPGIEAGIRYSGFHRIVYFAFGLEAVNTSAMRDTLMARSLEYLVDEWPDRERPEIDLLTPSGSEELECGTQFEITWTASDNVAVTAIDLLVSYDGGATWSDTAAAGEENDGSFSWTVPDSTSTQARVRAIARDGAGLAMFDDSGDFTTSSATTVPDPKDIITFRLYQNAPNPFNPVTSIFFDVPRSSRVRISIFNVKGQLVRDLADRTYLQGRQNVTWDGRDGQGTVSSSGVYFCRMEAGDFVETRKIILLR
ncbi:MAG TPA: T9SS type A sorting domain-containing protein, partial [Candidatus Krumholzibacterium sp.]|nr:T9SS type A sorting domain-containing protein [Candidatus Krumholzibacterium sp.]